MSGATTNGKRLITFVVLDCNNVRQRANGKGQGIYADLPAAYDPTGRGVIIAPLRAPALLGHHLRSACQPTMASLTASVEAK
jgi:hypothetical protein